jgi:hypothetical protein
LNSSTIGGNLLDPEQAMGIFILVSMIIGLILNVIFYRLVFRKRKRMNANSFSWLTTLLIMAPITVGLLFALVPEILQGLELVGIVFLLVFVLTPILWFVPTSLYTLIRTIFIVITRNREREILSKDIEEAELIGYEVSDEDSNL